MDSKILDVEDALERVQDDKELLSELLDIFVEDFEKKIKQLQDYFNDKNTEEVANVVHSIKGAAGNISAMHVQDTCAFIEKQAEAGILDDIEDKIKQLKLQYADLKVRIGEVKGELSA